jgi:phosphatidylglycerol:prolipoprotein diacylglycerol transferase
MDLRPCHRATTRGRASAGGSIAAEIFSLVLPKITWDVDPVLFYYPDWLSFMPGGGLRIYSLLFVGVFLGGYRLLDWQIKRAGGREEDASDFVIYGVVAVLAGSRIGHVFFYELDHFLEDPLWLFQIHKGGLASHGATLGLIFGMWLFCRRKRQSFLEGADRFSYAAALGATLVRVGNLFNSEIVGRKTDQTWGFYFPRFDREVVYRHPSQFYEITLGLFVMLVLYLVDKKLGEEKRPRGAMISTFFAVYFTGRFFVEFFKERQTISDDAVLTMGQILSIGPMLLGYYGFYWSLKKGVPAHWYTDEDDDGDEGEGQDEGEGEGEGKGKGKGEGEGEALPEAADTEKASSPKRDADVDAEFEK